MQKRAAPLCLGRDAELAAVVNSIDAAQNASSVIVVEGEAGMGKTTLIDAALAELGAASRRPIPVLRGECAQMESRRPFAVLAQAFGVTPGCTGIRGEIARALWPELTGATSPAARSAPLFPRPSDPEGSDVAGTEFRLGELFVGLLDEAVADGPAALVVEDLHWGDPASLACLAMMADVELPGPIAIVASCRPLPRPVGLVQLLSTWVGRGARQVTLGALRSGACRDVVAALVGSAPSADLVTLVGSAGGNPLFLTEAVHALLVDGVIEIGDDGIARARRQEWPSSVSLAILARLAFLGAETLDLLRLGAVLGTRFRVSDLADLADLRPSGCWARLQPAHRAGLVVDAGEELAFHHELVRDALYHDVPSSVRASLHSQAASSLARHGAPAPAVAEHLLRSDRRSDPETVAWLREAARQQLSTAPAVAVELLELALKGIEPGSVDHDALVVELGVALISAGRNLEGEVCLLDVLERARLDGATEVRARTRLVSSLLVRGEVALASAQADAALSSAGIASPARSRFRMFQAQASAFSGDMATAGALATQEYFDAVNRKDAPVQVHALILRSHVALHDAEVDAAVRFAGAAVTLSAEAGTSEAHEGLPDFWYSLALVDADRLDDAARVLQEASGRMQAFGTPASRALGHLFTAHWQYRAGQWDDAIVELDAAAALATRAGLEWDAELRCVGAIVACSRGHLAEARAVLADLDRRDVVVGTFFSAQPAWLRASICEAQGDADGALDAYITAWGLACRSGLPLERREHGPHLARLATSAGREDLVDDVVGTLGDLVIRSGPLPSLVAADERARGHAKGDPSLVEAAVASYRAAGHPYPAARSAEEAAVLWAKRGNSKEAGRCAREAMVGFQALGAAGEIARSRAALRAVGVRLGTGRRSARPRFGWEALTDTEARVARLVSARRSNPEIARELYLSRHTVVSHVSRVLAKLGVSSRTELVAAGAAGELELLGRQLFDGASGQARTSSARPKTSTWHSASSTSSTRAKSEAPTVTSRLGGQ